MIGGQGEGLGLRVPPISPAMLSPTAAASGAKAAVDFAAALKDADARDGAAQPAVRRRLPTATIETLNPGTGAMKQTPVDPRARDAAAKLVSQLFYIPMLQEMRSFSFGKELGSGGRGEEVFGEQLDIRLADAMARADRGGAVDQIARQIQKR
jgi:hypothetical protein